MALHWVGAAQKALIEAAWIAISVILPFTHMYVPIRELLTCIEAKAVGDDRPERADNKTGSLSTLLGQIRANLVLCDLVRYVIR
jgi:hypothetical protein